MQKTNQKCEMCTMLSTHNITDSKNITHYFCEHHSLEDINSKKIKHYKLLPLFFVITFIVFLSFVRQFVYGFDMMLWMMDFMGVFFIVFGLFKLYDLNGFVNVFRTYDVIAKRIPIFGYAYPFIEIILGIMYLASFMFLLQNIFALTLAGFGIYSAYDVIKNKKEIQCVCLGTVFNLPMTNVTLIENGVMFVMALFMLLM